MSETEGFKYQARDGRKRVLKFYRELAAMGSSSFNQPHVQ